MSCIDSPIVVLKRLKHRGVTPQAALSSKGTTLTSLKRAALAALTPLSPTLPNYFLDSYAYFRDAKDSQNQIHVHHLSILTKMFKLHPHTFLSKPVMESLEIIVEEVGDMKSTMMLRVITLLASALQDRVSLVDKKETRAPSPHVTSSALSILQALPSIIFMLPSLKISGQPRRLSLINSKLDDKAREYALAWRAMRRGLFNAHRLRNQYAKWLKENNELNATKQVLTTF